MTRKKPEIRPNVGIPIKNGRCEDTDEVVGYGHLHVEQMDEKCFWARLDPEGGGPGIVMWFRSKSPIMLIVETD